MKSLIERLGRQVVAEMNGGDWSQEFVSAFAFVDIIDLARDKEAAEEYAGGATINEPGPLRVVVLPGPRGDDASTRDEEEVTAAIQIMVMQSLGVSPETEAGTERVSQLMALLDEIRAFWVGKHVDDSVVDGELVGANADCETVSGATSMPRGYDASALVTRHQFMGVLIAQFTTEVELIN